MRSMLMRPLLCLSALIAAACSVETKPVPVLRVIDGNTIEVGADLSGVQVPVRVRLMYLACPEYQTGRHDDGASAFGSILEMLQPTYEVVLQSDGEKFEMDREGRALAVV